MIMPASVSIIASQLGSKRNLNCDHQPEYSNSQDKREERTLQTITKKMSFHL